MMDFEHFIWHFLVCVRNTNLSRNCDSVNFGGVTSNVLYMLDVCYEDNEMDLELFTLK